MTLNRALRPNLCNTAQVQKQRTRVRTARDQISQTTILIVLNSKDWGGGGVHTTNPFCGLIFLLKLVCFNQTGTRLAELPYVLYEFFIRFIFVMPDDDLRKGTKHVVFFCIPNMIFFIFR
jgi:hypothetical protein